jgi:peroxiredoxin
MDEFTSLNTVAIAIAQEDKDLKGHGRFTKSFDEIPGFTIVADLNRAETTDYDRVTTYLIDKEGVVRQIFPNLIHHRASWDAALEEIRHLTSDSADGESEEAGG